MSKQKPTRRVLLAGFFMATGVLTAAVVAPASASADPHVHDEVMMCQQLDINPTLGGVEGVAASWMAQFGDSHAAAQLGAETLIDAVTYLCPEYYSLVQQWAANQRSRGGQIA